MYYMHPVHFNIQSLILATVLHHTQECQQNRRSGSMHLCHTATAATERTPLILQHQTLNCMAVLQLQILDVGMNNITGTLPKSWSSMAQASTTTHILAFEHT